MNPRLSLGLTLCLSLLVATGCTTGAQRASSSFHMTSLHPDPTRVEIVLPSGDVDVFAMPGVSPSVSGETFIQGRSSAAAKRALSQVHLHAAPDPQQPGLLRVWLEHPKSVDCWSPGCNLHVLVPMECAVRVQTENGRVTVKSLRGDAWVSTSNARIEFGGVHGHMQAHTSNGRIVAIDVEGACELETSNADVHVEQGGGNLVARTSNGSIHATLQPPANAELTLESSNGDLHITLPKNFGVVAEVHTTNGNVSGHLPGNCTSETLPDGTCRHVINGGGGKLTAETSNGSIRLRAR